MKETRIDGEEDVKFGVTIPQFYLNCERSSQIERTRDGYILPKVATVNGRPLLLRIGLVPEEAGKLFCFMYRLLYGSKAVAGILAERNGTGQSPALADEAPASAPIRAQSPTDPLKNIPAAESVENADGADANRKTASQDKTPASTPVQAQMPETDPPSDTPSTTADEAPTSAPIRAQSPTDPPKNSPASASVEKADGADASRKTPSQGKTPASAPVQAQKPETDPPSDTSSTIS